MCSPRHVVLAQPVGGLELNEDSRGHYMGAMAKWVRVCTNLPSIFLLLNFGFALSAELSNIFF